jgi:YebC/PmpR family DNA-binding regulatory protein
MSGHSKWSTIKRKKGAIDAKRSKIFSRLSKEITVSAREGGMEPETNPRLRLAINNAKGVNMPKDNILRAITKAERDDSILQEVTYEGYLPNGIAVFIECLTDNINRTVGNIRSIFNKRSGNLGTNGSLSFIFERKGVFNVPKGNLDPEEFQLEIIDAGVEDFQIEEDVFVITCPLEDFGNLQKKLEELGVQPEVAELQRIPNEVKEIPVNDAIKILKIIEEFEDDDDVQNVFHNLDVNDAVMNAMDD